MASTPARSEERSAGPSEGFGAGIFEPKREAPAPRAPRPPREEPLPQPEPEPERKPEREPASDDGGFGLGIF